MNPTNIFVVALRFFVFKCVNVECAQSLHFFSAIRNSCLKWSNFNMCLWTSNDYVTCLTFKGLYRDESVNTKTWGVAQHVKHCSNVFVLLSIPPLTERINILVFEEDVFWRDCKSEFIKIRFISCLESISRTSLQLVLVNKKNYKFITFFVLLLYWSRFYSVNTYWLN